MKGGVGTLNFLDKSVYNFRVFSILAVYIISIILTLISVESYELLIMGFIHSSHFRLYKQGLITKLEQPLASWLIPHYCLMVKLMTSSSQ